MYLTSWVYYPKQNALFWSILESIAAFGKAVATTWLGIMNMP